MWILLIADEEIRTTSEEAAAEATKPLLIELATVKAERDFYKSRRGRFLVFGAICGLIPSSLLLALVLSGRA